MAKVRAPIAFSVTRRAAGTNAGAAIIITLDGLALSPFYEFRDEIHAAAFARRLAEGRPDVRGLRCAIR